MVFSAAEIFSYLMKIRLLQKILLIWWWSKARFISAVSNAIQTFKQKIMKQIISLSIVPIVFDKAEMRRLNRA